MFGWWKEGGRQERVLEAVLRVGAAGCFIGHGAFGIIGKEAWLPYFAVAGIPESWAWVLMPLVGTVDILMGIAVLLSPRPFMLAYMVVWAVWTALLRPLAGESFFETLERGGNYGVPLALLVAVGFTLRGSRLRGWFAPVRIGRLTPETRERVAWVLRGTIGLLLVGHGGLAIVGKPMLAEHMATVGMSASLLGAMGWGEVLLGLAIVARPAPALLVTALVWKVFTEALFPVTGAPIWEFVERAGSYAAPLALLAMTPAVAARLARPRALAGPAAVAALVGVLAVAVVVGSSASRGVALVEAVPAPAYVDGLLDAPAPTRADEVEALHAVTTTPGSRAVLDRLREGGLVLACRHAITDRSRGDARRVDYDDPSTQRVLSDRGRAQARRLGQVLSALDVPIGEVFTSPYARTKNSAELGFGRSQVSDALVYGNRPEQKAERRRLLTNPTDGANRVLMTHQGILYSSLDVERGSIGEGDCVVVAPRGAGKMDILGRYGPDEFEALGGSSEVSLHTSRTLFPSRSTTTQAIING